jgi:hypothetical protein
MFATALRIHALFALMELCGETFNFAYVFFPRKCTKSSKLSWGMFIIGFDLFILGLSEDIFTIQLYNVESFYDESFNVKSFNVDSFKVESFKVESCNLESLNIENHKT